MASLDKLLKAFEAVKVTQGKAKGGTKDGSGQLTKGGLDGPSSIVAAIGAHSQNIMPSTKDKILTPKDKLVLCQSLSESLLASAKSGNDSNMQKLLAISVESLLVLVNDEDPDVRMNADESLNRIIRCLPDTFVVKIQLEFFKEIKKNGPVRSLRAALSRFGLLCRLIRPQKCRVYIQNLLPHLVRMARRPEESLQETLSQALEKILPVLGHFTNDNEVRNLLRAFLPNMSSPHAAIRRSTAAAVLAMCNNARKPHFFLLWLLDRVLQTMIPVHDDLPTTLIIGGLLVLRHLGPHLPQLVTLGKEDSMFQEKSVVTVYDTLQLDQALQIYELCLHYSNSSDQNVVTSSLEALQSLLQNPPSHLLLKLIAPDGISSSKIFEENLFDLVSRTASQSSIAPSFMEDESVLDIESGSRIEFSAEELNATLDTPLKEAVDITEGFSDGIDLSAPVEEGEDAVEDRTDYASLEIGRIVDSSPLLNRTEFNLEKTKTPPKLNQKKLSEVADVLSPTVDIERESQNWLNGDIGTQFDEDVPLKFLVRHLTSSFLLSDNGTGLVPDKEIRVSVKALALSCIGLAISLQPSLLGEFLLVGREDSNCTDRSISDVLQYSTHPDPQLKTNVAFIIGHYINSNLISNKGHYSDCDQPSLGLESLLRQLCSLAKSSSSVTVRGALTGFGICLPELLHTDYAKSFLLVIPYIIEASTNSYWLVKVELCNMLSTLPLIFVDHLERSGERIGMNAIRSPFLSCFSERFSSRVMSAVFLPLLADEDHRVQGAVVKAIVKLVPHLMLSGEIVHKSCYFFSLSEKMAESSEFVDQEEEISHVEKLYARQLESNLSKLVYTLSTKLFLAGDKNLRMGCLESLSTLCNSYPPAKYPISWNCHLSKKSSRDGSHSSIISLVLSLASEAVLAGNLSAQRFCLGIACHHLMGQIIHNRVKLKRPSAEEKSRRWYSLGNPLLVPVANSIVTHIFRILNVYTHVIEDIIPGAKNFINIGAASTFSPVKRKNKSELLTEKMSSSKSEKADDDTKGKMSIEGYFHHLPEYIKLYDVVRNAHSTYKISLDDQTKQKLSDLLQTTLYYLGLILEIASVKEFGQLAEELLYYLKSISTLLPSESISCGRQLLKCLFGSNILSAWNSGKTLPTHYKPDDGYSFLPLDVWDYDSSDFSAGLHANVFDIPISSMKTDFQKRIEGKNDLSSKKIFTLRKRSFTSSKFQSSGADKFSLSYIRLFEPLVIRSLKLYTIASDVTLQRSVLELVINLVQIRVNYCLLDSEQIFIGFVIKQFEYVEEGQILKAEKLIPSIFNFLILLSYERNHSKSIIAVPKILQLCDGLLASGQPPLSHCILALEPLVKDLFLERGSTSVIDRDELEIQREVLCSMLFRLSHYYQVLHLLSLVLVSTHEINKERWRKLSFQVLDILLSLLTKLQLNLCSKQAVSTVEMLLNNICPTSFRPPDAVLKALLTCPVELESTETVERWVGGVLILLRVLTKRTSVDIVLLRLKHLGLSMDYIRSEPPSLASSLYQSLSPKRGLMDSSTDSGASIRDPLNVCKTQVLPQVAMARFFLEVLRVSGHELSNLQLSKVHIESFSNSGRLTDCDFLVHITHQLLLNLIYLVESGNWDPISTSLKEICNEETTVIAEIGDSFLEVARHHPSILIMWCKLLDALDFANVEFWSKIVRTTQRKKAAFGSPDESTDEDRLSNCLSLEFSRRAGFLLLANYVSRHMQEGEWLPWIVVQHISDLIILCKEPPVQRLLQDIYASMPASSLLIQAVHTRCDCVHKAEYARNVISVVSGIHPKQSGALIVFLVEKMLSSPLLVVSRMAAALCTQRLYLTLVASPDAPHLTNQDLRKLIKIIRENSIHKRYGQMFSLLQELFSQHDEHSADDLLQEAATGLIPSSSGQLDVTWYMHLVKSRCALGGGGGQECGRLLSHLDYDDALTIMSSRSFNKALLPYTMQLGLTMTLQANANWGDCDSSVGTVDSEDPSSDGHATEAPLYTASKVVLLQLVQKMTSFVPRPHMIFSRDCGNKYSDKLTALFSADSFVTSSVETVSAAVGEYMNSLQSLLWKTEIPPEEADSLLTFAVVCMEYLHWQTGCGQISISTCNACLSCVNAILFNTSLFNLLSFTDRSSFICSMVKSLYEIVLYFSQPSDFSRLPPQLLKTLNRLNAEQNSICCNLVQLIAWTENQEHKELPTSLAYSIKGIIVALGRTDFLNALARAPIEMFSMGWSPEISVGRVLSLPPLPPELLQETDALKQFIFRITLLGFIGRQQFEETWMLLLSVLNSTPTPETPKAELPYVNLSLSLAVRGITALLLQTMLTPHPGNPHSSKLLSIPRDKPPTFLTTKNGQKLQNVMQLLHQKLKEVHHMTRGGLRAAPQPYHAGQVSVEYLAAAVHSTHPIEDSPQHVLTISGCYEFDMREKQLNSCGLDVQSCLHFIRDLYSSWLQSDLCASVIADVVKSVSILCDLFTTSSHHCWVLESLVPLYSTYPVEDHITLQYLIVATSKALATLKSALKEVGSSLTEGVLHIVESGLRHAHSSVRACSIQALLYLLQANVGDNSVLLHMATWYIQKYNDGKSSECEIHEAAIWDLCIYLVEHYPNLPDSTLASTTLHMALTTAASAKTSPLILHKVLRGVERLVLVQQLSSSTVEVVLKLVMDLVLYGVPSVSLAALPLFVTALYVSTSCHAADSDSADGINNDPEVLLQLMEKGTVLFDRIRIGYPYEAGVLAGLLGTCLLDVLPASQILNKVITEYISSHQPHPHLLAFTLFQVFEGAIDEGGELLVQEWVLLSLSNFTQRTPVSLAVWCLTCFFIAASSSRWLRAAFPSVQGRLGRLEARDVDIFCLAATHFRQSLGDEEQRTKFDDAFQSAATPGSPFEELLITINKIKSE